MLRIKNLSKTYHDKKILNNVSLDVPQGEIAVLLGSSGVGKSTLLRLLNNLETLDSGTIELDGKLIDPREIHKQHIFGMVFQQFNLFEHLTAQENITLALTKVLKMPQADADAQAHKLLERFGLSDKALKYPHQLSGGQKQRLALARTLALKPKVLCLDEPTSALDPMLTNYVAQMIQELADEGYSILIATHDVVIIEKLRCTIYLMKDGTIIETASSHDLKAHPEKFPRIKAFIAGEQK